jgi:DNA-directed RNA polymerase subunit RPC12/RpoP
LPLLDPKKLLELRGTITNLGLKMIDRNYRCDGCGVNFYRKTITDKEHPSAKYECPQCGIPTRLVD